MPTDKFSSVYTTPAKETLVSLDPRGVVIKQVGSDDNGRLYDTILLDIESAKHLHAVLGEILNLKG
ncbi:hypothetical protein HYQ36_gp185 [Salmonella phage moki]|uniref:Uncharacterized protein n=5 Tax=Kuttervirus TaxID=2169536 RepID=A0A385ISF4_9CAUD|nr:hypothetical protein HYP54_gp181 [Escherichia phage FEC14]YP_009881105.1 hypothetical protein HYP68_gp088 [Salmonella phage SenASZ3]YP_009888908.1 hypothetical protein HYQ36_gp185 [Salmonella phage moki]YP_009966674.1 adenylyl-sulfate kinase [Salmonella phage Se-G]ATW66939.1 hypothetical protein [Escherichia phage FEC14]AXY86479.1 hypothetical protein SeSz3_88 [Salmonella phage SenASZ3]QIQ62458.1 hypothetical protein moki_185 [Salmonella phage moki]